MNKIFKFTSLFLVLLAILVSVHIFTTSPDIARLLGKPVGAVPAANLETPNPIVPSIQGFSNDLATATSVINYPLDLPAGPGGIRPSLSLSYSSAAVDDMHNGVGKECWGPTGEDCYDWTELYNQQAPWVGLGWSLGGLGYIVRKPGPDNQATPQGCQDDEFFLVFAGGSAKLINVGGGKWETDPKLFLKIEHQTSPTNKPYAYDTAPWLVTTPDGTKYYFGQPINADGFFLKREGSSETFPINFPLTRHQYDYDAFGQESLATAYTLIGQYAGEEGRQSTSKILGSRWMLRKVEDVQGNTIEIEYETRLKEVLNYGNINGWSSDACYPNRCPNAYIHDISPRKISWGKNTVEFVRTNDRTDWKIKDYAGDSQNSFTKGRLASIIVKVEGTIRQRYDFSYTYSQPPLRSPKEEITWGHLLLTEIKQRGKGGNGELPPYRFTYYSDGNYRFNNTLLASADNGYGGKVTFFYNEDGPRKAYVCNSYDYCEYGNQGEIGHGIFRNILVGKKVEDGLGNYFETKYNYFQSLEKAREGNIPLPLFFVYCPFKEICNNGEFEYLGFSEGEEVTFELNNSSKPVAKSKSYFYQFIRQADSCFNTDPRRGRIFKTEIFSPSSSQLLAKTETQFGVYPDYTPDNRGGLNCRLHPSLEKLPVFVAKIQEDNYQWDAAEIHTKTEYGPYDEYGNLRRQIEHGDVAKTGDERTTFWGYYPNTEKWILNRTAWENIFKGVQAENKDIPELLTQTLNFYDGANNYQTPPTKGNLTMIKKGREGKILIETKMAYDQYGNLVSQTDPNGNTTTTTYDSTYHAFPILVRNPLGHEVKTDYDFVLGVPTKITDPNGAVTEVQYDNFGRRLKVAKQPDSLASPTFIFAYRDGAPAITKTQAKIEEGKYTVGWQIANGLGQAIQTPTRAEVNGVMKDLLTTTKYDSLGRKILESQPYETSLATADFPSYTEEGWNSAPKSEFAYDDLGRIVQTKDALGRTTRNSYSGWTTTTTDANGRNSSVTQDAFGNIVVLADPQGNQIYYDYDILGNLTKVITPASASQPNNPLTTEIFYDALSRKTKMIDPDLGTWTYQYDANGNLIAQTDAKQQTIRFEYDQLNRLTKKTYPDGSQIVFEYDQGENAKGQRTKMRDLTGTTEYKYDIRGRLVEEKKKIENEEAVTLFRYNSANALVSITYPDGETVSQTYNEIGQLKKIQGENPYLTNVSYTLLGAVAGASFGNQTETQYEYDLTGRLRQIWTKNASTDLLKWAYSQDAVGNITKIEDLITPNKTLEFTYDSLDRLKTASGFYSAAYDYDPVGNMLKKVEGDEILTMLYADPAHAHAPKVVNGFEYKYDANGNLIEDEKRLIEWDYDNKPIRITMKETGQVTEFAYDGDGRRVIRRVLGIQAPSPSPTPNPTATPTITPESTLTPTPTPTPTETIPTASSTPTASLSPTPTPCPLASQGDLNCDGLINEVDITILLNRWEEPNLPSLQTLLDNWKVIP